MCLKYLQKLDRLAFRYRVLPGHPHGDLPHLEMLLIAYGIC